MLNLSVMLSCFVIVVSHVFAQEKGKFNTVEWNINNTENIAGYKTSKQGSPTIVETKDYGSVIHFNGDNTGLLVENNPLEGAENFTVEVIFKPDSTYPENVEQRFVHIQDPSYNNRRVLIELRMTEGNKWYLDTFIKADTTELTLVSPENLHPAGEWAHAALVYKNGIMTHYVNGKKEISGEVKYLPITNAFTSIGTRMNHISWFKGMIAVLKVTHKALSPDEFTLGENIK